MHAINNNGIKIIGAAIVRFSGKSKSGQMLETRQIVYVTRDSDKQFLSREACAALGIISKSFPTVGETTPAPPNLGWPRLQQTAPHRNHHQIPLTAQPRHSATAHVISYHHQSPHSYHPQMPSPIGNTYSSGSSITISQAPSTLVSTNPYHS